MRLLSTALMLTTLLALSTATLAAASSDTDDAIAAAKTWLAEVDAGDYGPSWEHAAAYFRGAITKSAWQGAVRGVRDPLGAVRSRELIGAQATTELPGAPDGEYVVIQFRVTFEHKASAIETITPMRDPDGSWRVSGYFIR